jgi:glutaminyl-peptide cyclotransferase
MGFDRPRGLGFGRAPLSSEPAESPLMKRIILVVLALVVVGVGSYFLYRSLQPGGIPVYRASVVATLPHDGAAFTEGLFFQDGMLYEGTGEVGTSGIRKVQPETGKVVQEEQLPAPYFGEGIVAWKDKLYEVTWQDRTGFIYGLNDFAPRGTFSYSGEGWGLTHNGKAIIMSDGTPVLRFLDPETLAPISTLKVTANGCPVEKLNELEWVDGEIYANIWETNLIARIDPSTGAVRGFLDVSALGPKARGVDDVPNGIAYDAAGKRLFVTGKRWPQLYQVKPGEHVATSEEADRITTCTH